MSKLILTCDQHLIDNNTYSFFIYDIDSNSIERVAPYTTLLDNEIDPNAGRPSFRPFGIAQYYDEILIASHSKIVSFNKDTLLPIRQVSNTGVLNTHQIEYYDGHLYRLNSSNDTITKININAKNEVHFSFKTMGVVPSITSPRKHMDEDEYHINSITFYNDQLYVMAHNLNRSDSEVFVMDTNFSSIRSISKLDKTCHELIIVDNILYSLGTGNGILIKLDLDTLELTKIPLVKNNEYFLRGAALINNTIHIFANQLRHNLYKKDTAMRIDYDIKTNRIDTYKVPGVSLVASLKQYLV